MLMIGIYVDVYWLSLYLFKQICAYQNFDCMLCVRQSIFSESGTRGFTQASNLKTFMNICEYYEFYV